MFGKTNRVIIKLQGGLGNQMFQYAVARSLTEEKSKVYLDHSFLNDNWNERENFTVRTYELSIFSRLQAKRVHAFHLNYIRNNSLPFKTLRNVFRPRVRYIHQENYEFAAIPKSNHCKYTYLEGYFQSAKHFDRIRALLLLEFRFPELDPINKVIQERINQSSNAVSIHFRRGDYLKSRTITEFHGLLPLKYYEKSLEILRGKCHKLNLFVFSDDITWIKENFSLVSFDVCFVDTNQVSGQWKDLALMKECKHHIIANSSFSWWGAWLSEKKGKVYAPENWFNSLKVKFNIHDFIPAHWEIISYE